MGEEFDTMIDIVKERIQDNANLSFKVEIQTQANKEEILVLTSDIKCAKVDIKLQQDKLDGYLRQLELEKALRESLGRKVEKLEAVT